MRGSALLLVLILYLGSLGYAVREGNGWLLFGVLVAAYGLAAIEIQRVPREDHVA